MLGPGPSANVLAKAASSVMRMLSNKVPDLTCRHKKRNDYLFRLPEQNDKSYSAIRTYLPQLNSDVLQAVESIDVRIILEVCEAQ